jgi:hypothetical protein
VTPAREPPGIAGAVAVHREGVPGGGDEVGRQPGVLGDGPAVDRRDDPEGVTGRIEDGADVVRRVAVARHDTDRTSVSGTPHVGLDVHIRRQGWVRDREGGGPAEPAVAAGVATGIGGTHVE